MSGGELEPRTVKASLRLGVHVICSLISWVGSFKSVIVSDLIDFIHLHDSNRTIVFSLSDLGGNEFVSVPQTFFSPPLIPRGRNGDDVCEDDFLPLKIVVMIFIIMVDWRACGQLRTSELWKRHFAMSVSLRVKATLKPHQHFLPLVLSQFTQAFG